MRYRDILCAQPSGKLDKETEQVTLQVTPQVEKLMNILHGEMSRSEIVEALGLKDRMHFVTGYLQPALNEGLVEMTIPEKPTSSKQRYRIATQGKEILKKDPKRNGP